MDVIGYIGERLPPFLGLFTEEATAIGLSLAILFALAILSAWFLWRAIGQNVLKVRSFVRRLDRIRNRTALASGLPAIDDAFRRSRLLRHAWNEFDETLLKPQPDEPPILRITTRPSEYFNRESCGLSFPVWHSLPHYFVGVGLLLTFIGLVAALYAVKTTVGENVDAATEGLKTLLGVATFKFLTSICGLFSSIVFSLIYHKGVKHLDKVFEDLCERFEHLTEFATVESIAAQQLVQLQKQREQLERFNTNIAMQIVEQMAEKLDATIADGLRRAIEPLSGAIDKLASGLGSQNLEALNQMADAFRLQLESGAGAEFRAVGDTLRELGENLRRLTDRFAEQTDSFRRQMGEVTEGLAAAIQGMGARLGATAGEAAEQMRVGAEGGARAIQTAIGSAGMEFAAKLDAVSGRIAETLRPLNERLASFETTLGALEGRLRDQVEAFDQVAVRASHAAETMGRAAEEMQGAANPLVETGRRLEVAAGQLSMGLDAIQKMHGGLHELSQRLQDVSSALERSWQSYAGRFDQVDQTLETVFSRFVDGTRSYHDTVQSFLNELNANLGRAMTSLSGGIQQLDSTVTDLADAMDGLAGRLRPAAE